MSYVDDGVGGGGDDSDDGDGDGDDDILRLMMMIMILMMIIMVVMRTVIILRPLLSLMSSSIIECLDTLVVSIGDRRLMLKGVLY